MTYVEKRLQEVYDRAKVIPFDSHSKFIIMSDCHRGQGNNGDNFLLNQNLFFGALEYYYKNDFTYIELGDGDELWENRELSLIIESHSDVFWLMSELYKQNRFHMIYGNHDIVKRKNSYIVKHCEHYYCDSKKCCVSLFPNIQMLEGLILENTTDKNRIFLTHGHQGDLLNDTLWMLARFLVRYLWGPLELVGFHAPTGAGRSHRVREKIEKKLSAYANAKQQILIAGHTHRPVFPNPGKSFYFNDGSCVHPRCITGIEIENNEITLVKWSVACTEKNRHLYVGRQILEGPYPLSEYYRQCPNK